MKRAMAFATLALFLAGCAAGNDPPVSSRGETSVLSGQNTTDQTDLARYIAATSEQPERYGLRHRCGYRRSWYPGSKPGYEDSWYSQHGLGRPNGDW